SGPRTTPTMLKCAPLLPTGMRYADSDGDLAVRIARAAIEARLFGRRMPPFEVPAHFEEKSGAFVTINTHPAGELRGCIGYPQVAVEENFDAADFLSQACMKAGLLPDAWLEPATRVYTFQAEVFTEVQPRGPIVRRKMEAARAGH